MGWWQGAHLALPESRDTTRSKGQRAEDQALAHLQAQGLALLARNYQTPGRGGGEIDLIMRATDGTVVFVEVRSRSHSGFGGAAQSIGTIKRQRIVRAAQHWLLHAGMHHPCRFDVVLLEGAQLEWLPGAFEVT